tara:strand:- start:5548 stop:6222 length:675 start_codon:yes stop_codon:yes gene_type:complete
LFLKKVHNFIIVGLVLAGCSKVVPLEPKKWVDVSKIEQCESIVNDEKRSLCTLTEIGKLLEAGELKQEHCDVVSQSQDRGDCYSYYSEISDNLMVCFKIQDLSTRDSCLGDIQRIFKPETLIKSLDLCDLFESDDKWLWANQCKLSYVIKNKSDDLDICKQISYPLAFYNCVKNVAYNRQDSEVCNVINERLPFPKNYPTLVFSENGCKYWVENEQSYKGLKLQ